MDCTDGQWRQCGYGLHGDVIAGFIHVHVDDDELHGDWSHERYELHVHGDGDECCRYRFRIDCLRCSGSGNRAGRADGRVGCVRLRAGRGVVECAF